MSDHARKRLIARPRGFERRRNIFQRFKSWRREIGGNALHFFLRKLQRARAANLLELARHLTAHFLNADRIDQNLDARLVHIVAASRLVVDAHHRFDECEYVGAGNEIADHMSDVRRTSHAAAGINAIADFTGVVLHDLNGEVMKLKHRTIGLSARDRDLELAREVGELRMQRGPLPDDLGEDARVFDLVGCSAREMIGRNVADAIAARLQRVHLYRRQLGQNVGNVHQLRPVELDVLPGREMAIALVVTARDMRELAQLARAQRAVGNGDAQHVGVKLQVETVHQPQWLELVFRQFAAQAPLDLITELLHPFRHEARVKLVIPIHGAPACRDRCGRWVLPRE